MQFKNSGLLLFASLVFQILLSCKDDPTQIGNGLLPSNDKLIVKYFESNIDSSNLFNLGESASTNDVVYLGTLNDPVFGQTSCQLLNEIRSAFVSDNKPKIADSLVLTLRYYKLFGNGHVKIKFSIYKMSDTLSLFKLYPSNMSANAYVDLSNPIGHGILNPSDTAITIRLSNDFMQELASLDSATLNTDSLFRKQKLGLYIRTEITDPLGAIIACNLNQQDKNASYSSYVNNLMLYYHTPNGSSFLEFSFISYIKPYSSYVYVNPKANIFSHNYASSKFINELNGKTKGPYLYTLGGGGIKSIVDFSKILTFDPKYHYAISSAMLYMPYYPNKDSAGSYVEQDSTLSLYLNNNNKVAYYDTTLMPKGTGYSTGSMDTINGYFKFNITQFVQNYFEEQNWQHDTSKNYSKIIITPSYSSSSVKGVILKRNGIKLKVKYTKF